MKAAKQLEINAVRVAVAALIFGIAFTIVFCISTIDFCISPGILWITA